MISILTQLKGTCRKFIPLAFNIIGLLTALALHKRAFVLGFLVAFCYTFYVLKDFKIKPYIIWLLTLLITVVAVILAVYFKTDSTLGRLLIYKISFNIFKEHWLWGIGLGKFKTTYLMYQAAYFKAGNFTEKELLLADNTKHAFNDSYEFIIEYGILGIIFIFSFFIKLYHVIKKASLLNVSKNLAVHLCISLLIVLSIASFFTHIFDYTVFQVALIIGLTFILYKVYNKSSFASGGIAIVGIISIYLYGDKIIKINDYQKFSKAQELYYAGYLMESRIEFDSLLESLNNDINFLIIYSQILRTHKEYRKEELILKLILKENVANMYYKQLADVYFNNSKFKEAERAYLLAINMVPNRFVTRFALYKFYQKTKNYGRAKQVAYQILTLPVKVNSYEIIQIKKEVKSFF